MKKACKSCHGKGDLESNENSASRRLEELSQPCSASRRFVVNPGRLWFLTWQVISALGHKDPSIVVGRESLRMIGVKLAIFSETSGQTLLLACKRVCSFLTRCGLLGF